MANWQQHALNDLDVKTTSLGYGLFATLGYHAKIANIKFSLYNFW